MISCPSDRSQEAGRGSRNLLIRSLGQLLQLGGGLAQLLYGQGIIGTRIRDDLLPLRSEPGGRQGQSKLAHSIARTTTAAWRRPRAASLRSGDNRHPYSR